MSDMMIRSRGLILSLVVAVLITGCVEQVAIQKQEPIRLFNREYYAVKNLTRADIRKMKEMMSASDKSAAKTAGLILGRHYVRNGDVEQGYKMIKANLDDSYLDRFIKVSGHIWLYDAANKMDDIAVIDEQLTYLKSIEIDPKAEKAIKHYCAQEGRAVTKELISCVTDEIVKDESPVEIEIFEEPKKVEESPDKPAVLMEKIKVNVKSSEADPKLMEAMLYTISKLGLDVELDFSGEKSDYDFTFDAYSKILTSSTNLYEFGLEMEKVYDEAVNLALLNGGSNLVIGYTEELYEKAMEIQDKYRDSDVKIYTFNIEDENFQSTLRGIKEQIGETETLSFAVGGSEKQLIKVVPFLRFYSGKPDKTVVALAVEGFGKQFFSPEYVEYFKGAYVVTEVLQLGKGDIERFNEEYYNDYQQLPEVKDMLGYDIIVFMEKIKNPSFMNEYLTGIKSLEEGRTVREMEAYKIVTSKKIRKLIN